MISGGEPISTTITPGIAALMAASSIASGAGAGISASMEADAAEDAAKEQALGPIRGGTTRAGNKGDVTATPNLATLEKLGQTSVPMRNPVYGNSAMPVDLEKLFQPKNFGSGFNAGNYNLTNTKKF